MVGRDGWVILEYIGSNSGDETWYGDHGTYVLGGTKQRGYVDQRDKAKLLAIRDRGKKVFKEYVEPVQVKVSELEPVASLPDWETVEKLPNWLTDTSSMTVSEVKELLPSLDLDELEQVLNSEKLGKGRSTAIAAIEDELNERLA